VNSMPGVKAEFVAVTFGVREVNNTGGSSRRLQGQTALDFFADYVVDMPKEEFDDLPAETTNSIQTASADVITSAQDAAVAVLEDAAVAVLETVPGVTDLQVIFKVKEAVVQETDASGEAVVQEPDASGVVTPSLIQPTSLDVTQPDQAAASASVIVFAVLGVLSCCLIGVAVQYCRNKAKAERRRYEDGQRAVEPNNSDSSGADVKPDEAAKDDVVLEVTDSWNLEDSYGDAIPAGLRVPAPTSRDNSGWFAGEVADEMFEDEMFEEMFPLALQQQQDVFKLDFYPHDKSDEVLAEGEVETE